MKHYIGQRTPAGCEVEVIDPTDPDGGYALDPRLDLRNHSPSGFEWNFSGSGPAQLSLALLADALGDDDKAQRLYQDYKRKVVARLEGDTWELSQEDVRQAASQLEAERGRGR